ncbi:MAG TPA: TonB-dependent receptor [Burkholderiales bacterium]|nr:TonB-dependent receptor [Burkholderiales bacterium]
MKTNHAVCAALAAVAQPLFAADAPVTLSPAVVVTATRFPEPAQSAPIGVRVISREDIERSTAATVPDLLRQLPGIRTRDNSGSLDVQVDMRGFGIFGDQNTLVLLDGVRVSENEQASVIWSAIPLSAIDRIEILPGSGAVLYGGGATGGTINIITKAPAANERSADLYGGVGSYRTREGRIGASVAGSNVGLRFNGTQLESDNYRDNNRLRERNGNADIRWSGESGKLVLKVGGDDQQLRLPGAISEAQIAANRRQAATPNDFANRTSSYVNLGGETTLGKAVLAANLGYREKNTNAFLVGSTIDSDMRVWSFSPRVKLPHELGGWSQTLVAGLDWDDWDFDNRNVSALLGTRAPHATQRNRALYAQDTVQLTPALTLAGGGRLHYVDYGVADRTAPTQGQTRERNLSAYDVALRYRLTDRLAAYGKIDYSFRVPNVNDVYNLFTGAVSLFEPQKAHNREIGLNFGAGAAQYRVAAYHMDLNNELFFDTQAFVNRNLPPTRRYGAEAEGRWALSAALDAYANYTYAVSEFRAGSFGAFPLAGKRVPLVPRHAANVGAGWSFAPGTRVDVVVRYVGTQVYDADETNTFGRLMPAYKVVDLKLAHKQRAWLYTAGIRNLLNEKYYSYGVRTDFPTFSAYPAQERSFFVAAQYHFQ